MGEILASYPSVKQRHEDNEILLTHCARCHSCTGSGQKGVHSYSDGKCDLHTPDQCACNDAIEQKPPVKVSTDALIDTSKPPELGAQCNTISGGGGFGCLNGYNFSFSQYAACGDSRAALTASPLRA